MSEPCPFRLDGRRILITGARGHLGEAMARAVKRQGGEPVLNGRSREALAPLAEDLSADILPFDASDPEACGQAAESLERLDGLVLNAYHGKVGTVDAIAPEDFEAAFRMNLLGPFTLVRACRPLLAEAARRNGRGGAAVVAIGSMYGSVSPDPRLYGDTGANNPVHYGATKAGMLQMARYLAVHLAAEGIRMNCLSPGPFPPPGIKDSNPEFHQGLCSRNPMGRIGAAEEAADAVVFLLSPASSYVTGVNLAVDGGWTAW